MADSPPSRRSIAGMADQDLLALVISASVRAKQLRAQASQAQSEESAWRRTLQFVRNEYRSRAQKAKNNHPTGEDHGPRR